MIDDGYIKDGLQFAVSGGLLVDVAKNNTITNNGATPTTDHNGRANRGWSFNGTSNWLATTGSNNFNLGNNPFTFCIGLKILQVADLRRIFGCNFSSTDHYNLSMESGGQLFFARRRNNDGVTKAIQTTAGAVTNGSKYYLVLKSKRTTVSNRIMLNDVAQTLTLNTFAEYDLTFDNPSLYIGAMYPNTNMSNIEVDEFLFYNRYLEDNETTYNYNYWLSH